MMIKIMIKIIYKIVRNLMKICLIMVQKYHQRINTYNSKDKKIKALTIYWLRQNKRWLWPIAFSKRSLV